MIAYVLRKVRLCCRKCLMGGHVLVECMSYWRSCLLEDRYYRKACIAVGDVLLGYGCHVFHENVLWEDMCRCACLYRSNHLSCCEFRHLVFFFLSTASFVCSETCFPRIYCWNIFLLGM